MRVWQSLAISPYIDPRSAVSIVSHSTIAHNLLLPSVPLYYKTFHIVQVKLYFATSQIKYHIYIYPTYIQTKWHVDTQSLSLTPLFPQGDVPPTSKQAGEVLATSNVTTRRSLPRARLQLALPLVLLSLPLHPRQSSLLVVEVRATHLPVTTASGQCSASMRSFRERR